MLLLCFFFSSASAAPHFIENAGQIQNQHLSSRSDIDFVLKEKGFQLFNGKGILIWQFQKSENNKVVYNRMEARQLAFNPDAKLTTAKPLLWGSYIGGNGTEENVFTAVDDSNVIYIAGNTTSTSGISTSGAHQESNLGSNYGRDAFLIKLKDAAPADTSVGIAPVSLLYGNAVFTISPNPVQRTATMHGMVADAAFPLQVSCSDAAGKTIWQQTLKQPEDLPLSLDFCRQPAGVYLLHIKAKGVSQSLKLVKE